MKKNEETFQDKFKNQMNLIRKDGIDGILHNRQNPVVIFEIKPKREPLKQVVMENPNEEFRRGKIDKERSPNFLEGKQRNITVEAGRNIINTNKRIHINNKNVIEESDLVTDIKNIKKDYNTPKRNKIQIGNKLNKVLENYNSPSFKDSHKRQDKNYYEEQMPVQKKNSQQNEFNNKNSKNNNFNSIKSQSTKKQVNSVEIPLNNGNKFHKQLTKDTPNQKHPISNESENYKPKDKHSQNKNRYYEEQDDDNYHSKDYNSNYRQVPEENRRMSIGNSVRFIVNDYKSNQYNSSSPHLQKIEPAQSYNNPCSQFYDQNEDINQLKKNNYNFSYKPYTLNDYKKINEKRIDMGKLGPNTGSEEWNKRHEKLQRVMEYEKEINKTNKEIIRKNSRSPEEVNQSILINQIQNSKRYKSENYSKNLKSPYVQLNNSNEINNYDSGYFKNNSINLQNQNHYTNDNLVTFNEKRQLRNNNNINNSNNINKVYNFSNDFTFRLPLNSDDYNKQQPHSHYN